MPEKLLLAAPRGYCAGVDRAVQTVERALELYGAPVYVRKEIVHNKFVVEQLRERGAVFVESEAEVPEGATVVFSAHGVAPAVHAGARERKLETIDATCPLVTKVHVEAKKFAADGYTIVLIGHAGHEEVEGTMGEAPESIVLVESEADVDRLDVPDPSRIAYISQTTLSVDETRSIINRLRQRFPAIVGPRTDDICYATTNRQAAVKQLAVQCDLVLVIGSRNSSNSNRLVEVAREHGADSLPDRQRDRGPRGVAGRQARGRDHLGRERARVARAAAGRVLPGPRDHRRAGARSGAGGRPLHAPEGDPAGQRRLDRCARSSSRISTSARTAGPTSCAATASGRRSWRGCPSSTGWCCSGTRSSCGTGRCATRWPPLRRCCARLGAALGRARRSSSPGNHDHALLRGWLERRDPAVPLGLESAVDPDPREPLGALVAALSPARVRVAYPGVWLRDDVYATHGHYGDRHNTVPILERLGAGLTVRVAGEPPAGRREPRTTRPRSRRCTRGPTRSPRAVGCGSGAAAASRSRRGSDSTGAAAGVRVFAAARWRSVWRRRSLG